MQIHVVYIGHRTEDLFNPRCTNVMRRILRLHTKKQSNPYTYFLALPLVLGVGTAYGLLTAGQGLNIIERT